MQDIYRWAMIIIYIVLAEIFLKYKKYPQLEYFKEKCKKHYYKLSMWR